MKSKRARIQRCKAATQQQQEPTPQDTAPTEPEDDLHLATAAAQTQEFVPSKTFLGQISGFAFRNGCEGVGYYRDNPPCSTASGTTTSPIQNAVIQLDDLIRDLRGDGCSDNSGNARSNSGSMVRATGNRKKQDRKKRRRGRRRALAPPRIWSGEMDVAQSDWREEGLVAVDSLNANCYNSAKDYLDRSAADVVLMQETKTLKKDHQRLTTNAASKGWRAVHNHAVEAGGGAASGGVAALARNHYGVDEYMVIPATGESHRMMAAQATIAINGGITVMSLYLHHSEGLSEANRHILEAAAAFLATIQGPWIVAAGWNMLPEVLIASKWPELVGGGGEGARRTYMRSKLLRQLCS